MDKMKLMAAAPEIVLLISACFILIADLFVKSAARTVTYVMALAALLAVGAIVWVFLVNDVLLYAFGGMFVTDPMANVLKLFCVLAAGLMLVYSQSYARARGLWRGELFTLALFSLLGIFVMISANNLLVVYLGLELQTLCMYALIALRRDDARATEAAMKYFVLGALASGFLLYGMSMMYGASGTLDINELSRRLSTGEIVNHPALVLGTVFIVAGLAFKMGVVPFHMWVPDVYQGAPTPITLMIGSAPKIAAFAISYRLLAEGMLPLARDWQQMLVLISVASLVIGNLTAIAQTNLKRMLAYSTIGQMGFMLLALLSGVSHGDASGAASAYSAAMFYVITYALTTLGTFGIILLLTREGFEAEEIADLRGLNKRSPWYAGIMLIMMFSLAGIPPMMGFDAKLVVIQALLSGGVTTGSIWLAVIAVLLSLIGAFYYLRIVKVMYFEEPAPEVAGQAIVATLDMRIALSVNGAMLLIIGILPQYLLRLCGEAMTKTLGG